MAIIRLAPWPGQGSVSCFFQFFLGYRVSSSFFSNPGNSYPLLSQLFLRNPGCFYWPGLGFKLGAGMVNHPAHLRYTGMSEHMSTFARRKKTLHWRPCCAEWQPAHPWALSDLRPMLQREQKFPFKVKPGGGKTKGRTSNFKIILRDIISPKVIFIASILKTSLLACKTKLLKSAIHNFLLFKIPIFYFYTILLSRKISLLFLYI